MLDSVKVNKIGIKLPSPRAGYVTVSLVTAAESSLHINPFSSAMTTVNTTCSEPSTAEM